MRKSRGSRAADAQQRLDRAALVHGGAGVGHAVEVRFEVEDALGIDASVEHVRRAEPSREL